MKRVTARRWYADAVSPEHLAKLERSWFLVSPPTLAMLFVVTVLVHVAFVTVLPWLGCPPVWREVCRFAAVFLRGGSFGAVTAVVMHRSRSVWTALGAGGTWIVLLHLIARFLVPAFAVGACP